MSRRKNDAAYLWDMLDACQTVRQVVTGVTYHDFERSEVLKRAIERFIEIIGEAARHVSDEMKSEHPEIPWRGIISQRHVIAHEYDEIQYERIWRIATIRVPELIELLTPLVPSPPPDKEL